MTIELSKRTRAFGEWSGKAVAVSESNPPIIADRAREAEVIKGIQQQIRAILSGEERVPRDAMGDVRQSLQFAIRNRGRRLIEVVGEVLTDDVFAQALEIAERRRPYSFRDEDGVIPSLLAAALVTTTPFLAKFRPHWVAPDGAPSGGKTRRQ